MFGSTFYSTTGLHGLHVCTGAIAFTIMYFIIGRIVYKALTTCLSSGPDADGLHMDPGPIPLLSMSIYLVTWWRERWPAWWYADHSRYSLQRREYSTSILWLWPIPSSGQCIRLLPDYGEPRSKCLITYHMPVLILWTNASNSGISGSKLRGYFNSIYGSVINSSWFKLHYIYLRACNLIWLNGS